MNYDEFTGRVQHRLELPGTGEAVRAIRATLSTLGERLQAGEASDLAAPLPMEIDRYLLTADSGQRFDFDEFVSRVHEREGMAEASDRADAAYHARVIVAVVAECAPAAELRQVRDQLPADYDGLFELVDAAE
ncbi:MAG: DUF2267 domain-containing protein [Haloarculaceae archaeon]